MFPDHLLPLRHYLHAACRLLDPGPAAKEAFQAGLLFLLQETGGMQGEEEARNQLAGIFQNPSLMPAFEPPRENSSPVCYSQAQGLRPGFEDMEFPNQPEAGQPVNENQLPPDRVLVQAPLPQILAEIQGLVRQMISSQPSGFPDDAALDKRIQELVTLLYKPQRA